MSMIIIGSTAWNFHDNKIQAKDLDLLLSKNSATPTFKHDPIIVTDKILSLVPFIIHDNKKYATLDALYTIKCSHLGFNFHCWQKHKNHILQLKKSGCKIIENLYEELVKFWKNNSKIKTVSLNKSKENFFNDAVDYIYDHDYLHELVAFPNNPVYTKCLKEGNEVLIDWKKFKLLSFHEQIKMFMEEITVIACERWLLNPKSVCTSILQAHSQSLQKTILTLTKGKATDFLIRNLEHFILPKYEMYKHILEVLGKEKMRKVDPNIFRELLIEPIEDENKYKEFLFDLFDGICEKEDIVDFIPYEYVDTYDKKIDENFNGTIHCYGIIKFKNKYYRAEWPDVSLYALPSKWSDIDKTITEVIPKQVTITKFEEIDE